MVLERFMGVGHLARLPQGSECRLALGLRLGGVDGRIDESGLFSNKEILLPQPFLDLFRQFKSRNLQLLINDSQQMSLATVMDSGPTQASYLENDGL